MQNVSYSIRIVLVRRWIIPMIVVGRCWYMFLDYVLVCRDRVIADMTILVLGVVVYSNYDVCGVSLIHVMMIEMLLVTVF